jgi:hypothetical protein
MHGTCPHSGVGVQELWGCPHAGGGSAGDICN